MYFWNIRESRGLQFLLNPLWSFLQQLALDKFWGYSQPSFLSFDLFFLILDSVIYTSGWTEREYPISVNILVDESNPCDWVSKATKNGWFTNSLATRWTDDFLWTVIETLARTNRSRRGVSYLFDLWVNFSFKLSHQNAIGSALSSFSIQSILEDL